MLRLERASKSDEIHVRLRTRERFLNPTFCTALAIAFSFHLLAAVLFHIKPFKIESQWIFPSVKVNSELGITPSDTDAFVLAQIEENKLLTPHVKPPPQSISRLPEVTEIHSPLPSKLSQEPYVPPRHFASLEKDPLQHAPLDFSFAYDSFAIAISGRLGERTLIDTMKPTQIISKSAPVKKFRTRYLVRIRRGYRDSILV